MKIGLALMLLAIYGQGLAQSSEVVGEVFPIAEKSFLVLIEERLKDLSDSGELEQLNQRWVNRVSEQANRPKALGLGRTDKLIKHYYTPEIRLDQDITANGRVLHPKGTVVNALEHVPNYKPCWLFFNADDAAQLRWANQQKQSCDNPKLILTGGAIHEAEQELQAAIYFDQEGRITTKLKIVHVPALVSREHNKLVIIEQAIKESGDAL